MQRRTERMRDELSDIRQDWERKRADPSVPGATSPQDGSSDAPESVEPESSG
jgi:hypothetical protein